MKKNLKIFILLSSFVAFTFLPSSFALAATKSKVQAPKNVATQSTNKSSNKPKDEQKKQPDKNQTVKTSSSAVASQSKLTKSTKVAQNKDNANTQKSKNNAATKSPVNENPKNEKASKENNETSEDSLKEKNTSQSNITEKNNLKLVIDEKSNNFDNSFESIQKESSSSGIFDDLEFVKILGVVFICACIFGVTIFTYLLSRKNNRPESKKERYRGAHFKD